MAKLIYQDPDSGQEVSVDIGPNAPEVTIGRNPGNTIRVNNPSISRKHAKIVFDGGQVTLYDLNSSNGSYVNGNRVQNQALEDGDRIRTGEFPLDFVETAQVDFGMPSPPAAHEPAFGAGAFGQQAYNNDLADLGPTGGGDDFYSDAVGHDGGQAFGESFGESYDEPLMLEDSDFEEVLTEASDAHEPAGTAQGIYPYQEDEDDEDIHYFADDGDFYEEEVPVDSLNIEPVDDSLDNDDTLNAARGDMLSGMAAPREPQPVAQAPVAELPAAQAPLADAAQLSRVAQMELEELRGQVERLESERVKLLEEIDANAQNPQGGAQRQLDRLRSERNRLSEERRTLIGQLKEARAELDERPEIEEIEEAKATINASRQEISELEQALASARQDIGERDASVEALQAQIDQLQGELDEVQQDYNAIAEEKSAVASQSSQLGGELEQTQAKLSDLQSRYELSEATIESLETDLAELNNQRDALRQDVEARDKTVEDQDAQIADLKEHAKSQHDEIESLSAREESLKATISQLEAEVEELEATLEARPTEANVNALREELASTLEQLTTTTTERDALLEERALLQQDLAETRELLSDIQERIDIVSAERDEARRERDAHKLEKQAFARETDYLQTNRRKWVEQIEELEAKVAGFEADNKKKKKIFAELSGDLRALVQSNELLKSELGEAKQMLESGPSADDLQARDERISQLEEQLESTRNEMADLNADSSELTRQLGEIAQQRDEIAEELEQAKLAHEEKLAEMAEMAEQIAQAGDENAVDLEAIQAEHQSELEAAQAERDELREQVETLEELLSAASEAAAGDGDADEQLQARIAELEGELADREATLAELILARDELEDKLKSQAS
ncbi:FHA domain-containing protein [Bradymonas sediminis]|uniref:Uncharacterized protein n=1 Tax=Bradymonas sediminis TaxID=1548548 RepID=A0A2Z4FJX6_9DELT|nr:FHA domain-containing protein [Bradymonas sediminis]AWV89249.1 hypothetical protein DN745_07805 [Bradymonas sediminis]TDP73419.1 FHA domain-containing protein [Bradymonas sediminis]